jgi:hypothetical protein
MDTLDFIVKKYDIDLTRESPFELKLCRKLVLPTLFKDLGFNTGVEVGVLDGTYSEVLCKDIPNLKLYSVDKWAVYPIYHNRRKQYHYDAAYGQALEKLKPYPNCQIIKEWSMDAVKQFEDNSLDFVFIDANHDFEHITEDIAEWGKKVRIGGIISGHDFGDSPRSLFCSVETVVRAWTKAKRIHRWFILNSELTADERSWMWVKAEPWKKGKQ